MRKKFGGTVFKLIVFALVSVILTTVVVATLLDLDTSSTHSYHAMFDNASGLESGDIVAIAGVEVGKVNGVSLDHDIAKVSFSLDSAQHITTTTDAEVGFQNLLGNRYLMLLPGATAGTPLKSGATIPTSRTNAGLDLTALFNGFQPLFSALTPSEINQLTASIIAVFQGSSDTLAGLLKQTSTLTNNLADRGQIIDEVLDNLTPLLTQVSAHDQQLGSLITNFDSFVQGLANDRFQLGTAVSSVGTLTKNLSTVLGQAQPDLNADIKGLATATGKLGGDQTQIDSFLKYLSPFVSTLAKVSNSGNYLSVYVCNLTVQATGPLNVSLVPGVTGHITLPTGTVGDPKDHTSNCA